MAWARWPDSRGLSGLNPWNTHSMQEKGSGVSLGAHFSTMRGRGCSMRWWISKDTDLVTLIQMVTVEQGKSVFFVCPVRWQVAPQLRSVARHVRHIHRGMLRDAQAPTRIPVTTTKRRSQW